MDVKDLHAYLHLHLPTIVVGLDRLTDVVHELRSIRHELQRIENHMTALDDAVAAVGTAVSANEPKIQALADMVSSHTATQQARLDALMNQVTDLQNQIKAGTDTTAAVAALNDIVAEAQAEGAKIDEATTALAAAFVPPAP